MWAVPLLPAGYKLIYAPPTSPMRLPLARSIELSQTRKRGGGET